MLCVSLLLVTAAEVKAKLSQPDYVLYGTATWFGGGLPAESEISIYLNNQLLTVATYRMGTIDTLNGLYALRVPMDSNDPRTFSKARPGDPASIFINGSLVADVLVGDYGTAERLDIDPINLAENVSVVSVLSGEVTEGNQGQTTLVMSVMLSNPAEAEVSMDWITIDDTAVSSDSCGFDVDYIESAGRLTIPIGSDSGQILVTVCGDTLIESSEQFELVVSNAQNAVIQFDRAAGVILDDDGLPELRGFDAVIFEPQSGSLVYDFELKLSRPFEQSVSVAFTTLDESTVQNLDYLPENGTLIIPAGQTSATISVTFLSDTITESIEIMKIELSDAVNATLVNSTLTAFILDANKEDQVKPDNVIDNNAVPELINPSDVLFSQQDNYVYVSTLDNGGSILRFEFDNGDLTFQQIINTQSVGFESGLFGLIRDMTLSNDGQFLYAAASGDQSIMSFTRNSSDGTLALVQTLENNSTEDFGIDGVYGLAISPDGNHLYAVGSQSDALSVFAINQIDGSLTFVEKEVQGVNDPDDSGTEVTFMDRPIDVKVSPDGNAVFVAADFSSSLVVFDRTAVDGKLNYRESFKSGIAGVTGLGGAAAVEVSVDGTQVFVLGRAADSLVVFNRDDQGQLSFDESLNQQNADFIGLNSPTAILSNQDSSRIYALGFEDSSLVTFERKNVSTDLFFGELNFADIDQDESNGITSLAGPVAMDLSSQGDWLIVAAALDNALTVFKTHLNDLIYTNGFE